MGQAKRKHCLVSGLNPPLGCHYISERLHLKVAFSCDWIKREQEHELQNELNCFRSFGLTYSLMVCAFLSYMGRCTCFNVLFGWATFILHAWNLVQTLTFGSGWILTSYYVMMWKQHGRNQKCHSQGLWHEHASTASAIFAGSLPSVLVRLTFTASPGGPIKFHHIF